MSVDYSSEARVELIFRLGVVDEAEDRRARVRLVQGALERSRYLLEGEVGVKRDALGDVFDGGLRHGLG